MRNTVILSDLHIPHENAKALQFVKRIRDRYKCQDAVSVGDLYDWHSTSFHSHDPDLDGPKRELDAGRKHVAPWFKEFPKLVITTGNHDAIPARKLFEMGLPAEMLVGFNDLYSTPGWQWKDDHIVKGGRHDIWFRHHWAPKVINNGGDGGYSVVCGHTHSKAQIVWSQYPSHSTFSMITGCLISLQNRAFSYNKYDAKRPILSCATIIDGEPQIHRLFE